MEIKVTRIEDGPARVEVHNPATGETISSTDVNVGEEVVLTASTAHEPGDILVGAVVPTAADAAEGEQGDKAETGQGEEPGEAQPGEEPGSTE